MHAWPNVGDVYARPDSDELLLVLGHEPSFTTLDGTPRVTCLKAARYDSTWRKYRDSIPLTDFDTLRPAQSPSSGVVGAYADGGDGQPKLVTTRTGRSQLNLEKAAWLVRSICQALDVTTTRLSTAIDDLDRLEGLLRDAAAIMGEAPGYRTAAAEAEDTHDGVPDHRRPDIIAMIERGDFDEK